MTILDKIVAAKKAALARQKVAVPLKKFLGFFDGPLAAPRFGRVLEKRGFHLIAEVKKASPSVGVIRKNFDYLAIARGYESAGASCLSVLTENRYFQGRLSYFDDIREAVRLPMLRKDFIIDPYQIYESKLHRADAILLIASILGERKLAQFLELCAELRLDALVEVHDAYRAQHA
jgi:indole-3-glycerol phosphate synthase